MKLSRSVTGRICPPPTNHDLDPLEINRSFSLLCSTLKCMMICVSTFSFTNSRLKILALCRHLNVGMSMLLIIYSARSRSTPWEKSMVKIGEGKIMTYVMWSSKMSGNSQILFFKIQPNKLDSFFCFFNPSNAFIFGIICPISEGFSPN